MTQADDKYSDLRARTKMYASRIIRLYSYLRQSCHFDDAAMVIAKQLIALRSNVQTLCAQTFKRSAL